MLHTSTAKNSAFNSGSLQAATCLFLNLPPEIHRKIGTLLDPKALSNIIQTCHQCKADYDMDVNFIPFLKLEYQKQVPKQLSKEMFAFNARKKFNIIFTHSSQLLEKKSIKYLLMNDIVKKKDLPFFSKSELSSFCTRFRNPHIKELIDSNLLSVEEVKSLTDQLFERLREGPICQLFRSGHLSSLEDINNLTNKQAYRLCSYSIRKLFVEKKLSLRDVDGLTNKQFERIWENDIYWLFAEDKLSLEDLECLSMELYFRLQISTIYALLRDNKLSFKDFKSLSQKQVDRLSTYNSYCLFRDGKLSLQDIEHFSDSQVADLSVSNMFFRMKTRAWFYWNSAWTFWKNQPS